MLTLAFTFLMSKQVHGGFLNAYDSVRHRLMTLVQASLGIRFVLSNHDSCQSTYLALLQGIYVLKYINSEAQYPKNLVVY